MASYFGKTLDMMFGSEIFGTRKMMIPPPCFYVLYLGKKDAPAVEIVRLSGHYTEAAPENSIEIVVKIYNICYNENKDILQKSRTLREYSLFINYVNENLDKGMTLEDAVEITVERAKEEGVLVDFLNRYGTEVTGMLRGITVEEYGEVMKKEGFDDGKIAGEASGRAAEKLEMAKTMKADNEPIEKIAKYTGLSMADIERL